jgi:hypothetical protein
MAAYRFSPRPLILSRFRAARHFQPFSSFSFSSLSFSIDAAPLSSPFSSATPLSIADRCRFSFHARVIVYFRRFHITFSFFRPLSLSCLAARPPYAATPHCASRRREPPADSQPH